MNQLVSNQPKSLIDLNSTSTMMVPEHLQGLAPVVGKIPVGDSRNRIGFKGGYFHIFKGGIEVETVENRYLDVVIVGAVPAVSRKYFDRPWEEGVALAPVCYSANGIAPPPDVKSPQSAKCMGCPQDVKGSSLSGDMKAKACSYFRRIAVVIVGDSDNMVYQVDVAAMGLFDREGDPKANKYSFNEYVKKLASANNGAGIDVGHVITRLSFDAAASVPKLYFHPAGFIDQNMTTQILDLIENNAIAPVLEISMNTMDLSQETPAAEAQAPAQRVAPQQQVRQAAPQQQVRQPVQQRQAPVQQEPVYEDVPEDQPTLRQPQQQVRQAPVQQVRQPAPQVRQAVQPQVRQQVRPTAPAQVELPPEDDALDPPLNIGYGKQARPQATRAPAPTRQPVQQAQSDDGELDALLADLDS